MNVNDGKWFRSLGAEKLMEAEEREVKMLVGINLTEREVKDMAEIKEATVLEAVPSDIVVIDKDTGKKMILLGITNYAISADEDGKICVSDIQDVRVLLTAEQKALLE